jgi:hypothetical protein
LSEFRAATGSSGENQKQAHLFMICSNIKLRPAAESIRIGGLVLHPRNKLIRNPPTASLIMPYRPTCDRTAPDAQGRSPDESETFSLRR